MNFRDKLLLGVVAIALLGLFIYSVSSILLPFVVAIIASYFLNPAVDKLDRSGIPRAFGSLIIIASFFTIVAVIIILVAPVFYNQFVEMTTKIPEYINAANKTILPSVNSFVRKFAPDLMVKAKESVSALSLYILQFIGKIMQNIWSSGMFLVNMFSLIFIMPVITFYIMRDWHKIVVKIDRLIPTKYTPAVREQFAEIDMILSGYIRGQINVCILLGVFYAASLMIVGLEFGFFIGIATGMLAIIPYVGLLVGFALGIIVAILQFGDVINVSIVAGIFVVGQFVEGNFITPRMVGNKVGLHPVWIIFGMMAAAAMFGFTGILVAIPVTAIIGVFVRFAIRKYLKSPIAA
jgi:predicted PurR-regulated permease PerM